MAPEINTDKSHAWWQARHAHQDYMRTQAMGVGWNKKEWADARDEYFRLCDEYREKYGVMFDPYSRPATVCDYTELRTRKLA